VALELAGRGATVLLHDRDGRRCEAALEEVRRQTGWRIMQDERNPLLANDSPVLDIPIW